jgi:hypothetical protein
MSVNAKSLMHSVEIDAINAGTVVTTLGVLRDSFDHGLHQDMLKTISWLDPLVHMDIN